TLWETGSRYWGWIPRLDVILGLGVLVALVAPQLGFRRAPAWGAAGALVLLAVVVGAVLFVPQGVTLTADSPAAGASLHTDVGDAQPADNPAPQDWPAYGGGNAAQRYSPLSQITPENVAQLEVAWQYRTGDLLEHRWGAETTPLKIGDAVYLC